ncbi:MAG: PH domain-containing protein [Oscillospiraceae bacterium]|nr:PH domain-containing protein [Oscillospiraceae bacterium]
MTAHKPDKRLLTIWRASLALLVLIPAFIISLIFEIMGTLWLILTGAWLLVFLVFYIWYFPFAYQSRSFYIEGNQIFQTGGVIYKYSQCLPIANIQYATIITSPFDRLFGLCALSIVAPGGRMTISGLRPGSARELLEILTGYPEDTKSIDN